ncbi:MAG: hypothetical protein VB122_04635 [Erysipelotrichales bacterium]|nr:hypothetical protein [Erysipelotrichales bacterium]
MKKNFLLVVVFLITSIINSNAQDYLLKEKVFQNDLTQSQNFVNVVNWSVINTVDFEKEISQKNEKTASITININAILHKRDESATRFINYLSRFSLKIDCRDNRYRVIFQNPQINLKSDVEDLSSLSTGSLERAIKEMEAVVRISENYFNELPYWDYNKVISIIEQKKIRKEEINKEIVSLGKDRRNRREVRAANEEYNDLENELIVLNEAITRMEIFISTLFVDLESAVNFVDDF